MDRLKQQWQLFSASAIIYVIVGQIGMLNGWTSPELPYLQGPNSSIPTTSSQGSTIAVVKVLGEIICNPIAILCNENFGRKFTIFFSIVPFITSWTIMIFATSVLHIIIGRIIGGIGTGFILMGATTFIGDVATDDIRGSLLLGVIVFGNLGTVFVYIVGLYPELWFPSIFGITPLILILFTVFWFPESPYFLFKKGRKDDARKMLQKLRNKEDVYEEFDKMEVNEKIFDKNLLKEFIIHKSSYKPLLIGLALITFAQFSGGTSITMYSHLIFQKAEDLSIGLLAIIRATCQLITSVVASYIVDRIQRKLLLIISCLGVVVFMALEGSYFYLQDNGYNVEPIWWLPLFALVAYNMFCLIGLTSVETVYSAELFHPKLRSFSLGIMWFYTSISIIIVGKMFQILIDTYSFCIPFFVFSAVGLIGFVFVLFVPETKGRSLEEMQYYFENNNFKNNNSNTIL